MPLIHSVLIPHRNRPEHVDLCCEAVERAMQDRQDIELVVIDASPEPIDQPDWVRIIHQPQDGLFNKSRAINYGVQHCRGEFVTLLDCDTLVPPTWLTAITSFYETAENRDIRLGHRVRLLDSPISATIRQFGYDQFLSRVVPEPARWKFAAENYDGRSTGNSHVTLRKANFFALGGYDERFEGYGLEDVDFNCRAAQKFAFDILPDNDTFHLHHKPNQPGWRDEQAEIRNRGLFTANERAHFPQLPPLEPIARQPCCWRINAEGIKTQIAE